MWSLATTSERTYDAILINAKNLSITVFDSLRSLPNRDATGANKLRLFSFFFSSRRRHTRLVSDWSSDVCSSDLFFLQPPLPSQVLVPGQLSGSSTSAATYEQVPAVLPLPLQFMQVGHVPDSQHTPLTQLLVSQSVLRTQPPPCAEQVHVSPVQTVPPLRISSPPNMTILRRCGSKTIAFR